MRIIRAARELQSGDRKVCLALGFFDGVHLGHQQIIRQTISDARAHDAAALVITFDRHPASIVAPQRVPPLIHSLEQKLAAIAALGAENLLLIHFDLPFSEQSGEAFVRALAADLGRIQNVCVGSTFVFGHKRGGNVALLKTLGAELHFAVHGMSAVSLGGRIVSSTRIRETIRLGDFDAAGQMLGRRYTLAGQVVRGRQLGRQLGFPTANVDTTGLVLPPNGVYAVHARTDGITRRAVVNIGCRPTVENAAPQITVEAHLLDFDGDLYGRELELTFAAHLRPEQRFPSLEELKQQIARDIEEARTRF